MILNSNLKQVLHKFTLALNLLISIIVITYFWFSRKNFFDPVPFYILFLVLIYVLIEIIKKNFLYLSKIWYRIYYLGLIAVLLPQLMNDTTQVSLFKALNEFGVLFLILPVLLEGKAVISNSNVKVEKS